MAATWTRVNVAGEDAHEAARSTKSVQATTEAAPTLVSDGVDIDGCAGFNLFAEADSGQTFTGTGSFPGFVYDPICGWSRAAELDASVVAADASNRRIFLGAFPISAPTGRVAHVCNGVGVTAGGVTLYYALVGLYGRRI